MTVRLLKQLLGVIFLSSLGSCNNNFQETTTEHKIDSIQSNIWAQTRDTRDTRDFIQIKKYIESYPETEHFDSAISLYFELQRQLFDSVGIPIWHCWRNCASISIDSSGIIQFEDQEIHLKSIRQKALDFISNKDTSEFGPEFKEYVDSEGSRHYYTKGHFSITTTENAKRELQGVIIELRSAISDYKSNLSFEWYKTDYQKLPKEQQAYLDSLFQTRLVIWDFIKIPEPPKPPN